MNKRGATNQIFSSLPGEKMRFIAGPRQCGKTTLTKEFLQSINCSSLYYNWDRRDIRTKYRQNPYFYAGDLLAATKKNPWICFDEIHKVPGWKNILKDIFDTDGEKAHFVVTGSARLDLFRKSGDSLAGRYFLYHLFPLSLCELTQSFSIFTKPEATALAFIEKQISQTAHYLEYEQLITYSGFPEPALKANAAFLQQWQDNYVDTIVKEDIRDLTHIRDLEKIIQLYTLLPSKIGSPLSINALTRDIEASYPAIKNYLSALELTYMTFSLQPYTKKINRSVLKEKKIYLFDWTRISNLAIRFENYVAVELLQMVTHWKDAGWGRFELQYVRDKAGKESDFLIVKDAQPWLLIECKLKDTTITGHHFKHAEQLGSIPILQLIHEPKTLERIGTNAYVASVSRFFS